MPAVLVCPHGHRSELPTGAPTPSAEVPAHCPVCGAAIAAAHDVTEADTIPPAVPLAAETAALLKAGVDGPAPRIPGYDILGELGRGGMGVVFRARQLHLDRLVAIKVLPTETGKETSFAERFTREARALARLNHPNILTVYDFGQAEGQSYFVMEYVDGTTLRQRLHQSPVPVAEALRVITAVCEALQYAHDEGIVHRDIKPENVLLDRKGRVKIADFGIAKLLTRKTGDYTLTGPWHVMGTWHYMAPEQMENPQSLDHRADIYAVGVMLYELLTGSLPQGHFPPPSQKRGTNARLDAVVLKAIARDPADRYQSAADMKAALEVCQDHPVEAPGRLARLNDTAVLTGAVAPFSNQDAWIRRVRVPALFLLVTGVLSLIPSVLLIAVRSWHNYHLFQNDLDYVLIWVAMPAAALVIAGGIAFYCRRLYPLAIIGSCVSMLPYTYTWPLGVAAGAGALVHLLRRDIRAAYDGTVLADSVGESPSHRLFAWLTNTSFWCMVCAAVGAFFCWQPWLPWATVRVYDSVGYPIDPPMVTVHNFQPYAIIPGIAFTVLLLIWLATGPVGERSLWRALLVLLVAGVAVVTTGVAFTDLPRPAAIGTTATSKAAKAGPLLNGQPNAVDPAQVRTTYIVLGDARSIAFDAYPAGLAGNTVWAGPHATYYLENGRTESVMLDPNVAFSTKVFFDHLAFSAGAPIYWTLAMGVCLVVLGALRIRRMLISGDMRITRL